MSTRPIPTPDDFAGFTTERRTIAMSSSLTSFERPALILAVIRARRNYATIRVTSLANFGWPLSPSSEAQYCLAIRMVGVSQEYNETIIIGVKCEQKVFKCGVFPM